MSDFHNLTGRPAEHRAALLQHAESNVAAAAAQHFVRQMQAAIDAGGVTGSTAVMALALAAHGALKIGANLWADGAGLNRPDTWEAIRSFVTDLPPAIESDVVKREDI